ncbi:MAG: TIGR04255 family protein [Nitrospirota bacterium]
MSLKCGHSNPIIEALCEFQFIPSQPWDMTIPGLFYDKIKDRFPEKKQQIELGIAFRPVEGGIEKQDIVSQRMQFHNLEKTALVQMGNDLLAVNHLRPYPTWAKFKPLILDNLIQYQKVASPKGLNRIELRYINQIQFDKAPIEIKDYFHYFPSIPATLPQMHEPLTMSVGIPYEDKNDGLTLTLTMLPKLPEGISFLLDLNYIMGVPGRIALDQVSDWLEKTHTVIETAFEACITEKCQTLFKEKK